ncbi:TPA: type IIL restriction-modification enzyme MmeI, partial [Enterococcus faecium]
SISNLPSLKFGSMANDGGNLVFSVAEYWNLIQKYPDIKHLFKKYLGSTGLINGDLRYTLWLTEEDATRYKQNSLIKETIKNVKSYREKSKRKETRALAEKPWSFGEVRYDETSENSILIPRVSSEKRDYVPMGIVGSDTIISDSAMAIYNAPMWLLGLLESRMHMVWLRSVGGKLETRYRYSAGLVYNTFPIQDLSAQRKNEMTRVMTEILDLREYEGGTLADLYNKDSMPESLRKKHQELDGIVDRAYQQRPFESDEDRLGTLLKLYQEMTIND